jgi:hypothetical protein
MFLEKKKKIKNYLSINSKYLKSSNYLINLSSHIHSSTVELTAHNNVFNIYI